jgi:glycosyltransferase involved in cell wall biosynthesis
VHEWLTTIGGSEKVLEAIYQLYPSPIYTLLADKKNLQGSGFENADIHVSRIQRFPFATKMYRRYLNYFPFEIEQFDLSQYDMVISSNHCVAKGVLTNAHQIHVCYCHTPMRYAWDQYHQSLNDSGFSKGIKSHIARKALHKIRLWDVVSANRVDHYIANSKYIANRIEKTYRRRADVIYPPVDVDRFTLCTDKQDFYLAVSRMVPYKNIGFIVNAFSHIPKKKLVVIGDGPEYKTIKSHAPKNVELLGYQPDSVLNDYLGKAKAFIFAAEEDFGILPVEAQACGTPVIAYGRGGALETVTHGISGILFADLDIESFIDAIRIFERQEKAFRPDSIRNGVKKFSVNRFKEEFKSYIEHLI